MQEVGSRRAPAKRSAGSRVIPCVVCQIFLDAWLGKPGGLRCHYSQASRALCRKRSESCGEADMRAESAAKAGPRPGLVLAPSAPRLRVLGLSFVQVLPPRHRPTDSNENESRCRSPSRCPRICVCTLPETEQFVLLVRFAVRAWSLATAYECLFLIVADYCCIMDTACAMRALGNDEALCITIGYAAVLGCHASVFWILESHGSEKFLEYSLPCFSFHA